MSQPIDPTAEDRLLTAFRALVRAELAQYAYLGVFEYVVVATSGTTIDCAPLDTSIPLPEQVQVDMRPGTIGDVTVPLPGSRCLISFVNGDTTKAVCLSINGPPVSVSIGAAPLPLARSAGTVTALTALQTYVAAVTTAANTAGGYTAFATAVATAGSTLAGAIAPAITAVPTTVLKAM